MKHSTLYIWLVVISLILAACSPVQPKPGAILSGNISMDKAASARLTIKISADGKTIESLSGSFTGIKCEGFSAGSTSNTQSMRTPITDGVFEIEGSNLGDISGKFTSPTEAEGTIHLMFFDGKAECGTWEWSAAGN